MAGTTAGGAPITSTTPASTAVGSTATIGQGNVVTPAATAATAAQTANQGKPGYDVFGNAVSGTPLSSGGSAAPIEPTVLSSDNASSTAASNMQKLNSLPTTGQQVGADNLVRNADGSFAEAPTGATQNEDGTFSSGGINYALGNSAGTISSDPTTQGLYDQLTTLKGQMDATGAANISNIQNMYGQLIQQQEQANAGNQASTYTLLQRGGSLQTGSSGGIINAQVSYGLSQISDLQNKETAAITAAQQAQQTGDLDIVDKQLAIAQSANQAKQAAAQKLSDALIAASQKQKDAQAQATKDSTIQAVLATGVTDPADILATLQKNGNTDITAADIGSAMANLNPDAKAIVGVLSDAQKFGAPASVITAIGNAKTLTDAYKAAGQYLLDPTTPAGQYAAYVKQATALGQTPISPAAYADKQKYNEAYATASGTEAGKTAGDNAISATNTISGLDADTQAALKNNGFTSYNSSTQDLATQLVTGQLAPSELSKRTTGASSYSDVLNAANAYSKATTGKPFNISQADIQYKFATNQSTQNTLNYLGSLIGSDDGTGKLIGGNLNQLVDQASSLNDTVNPVPGTEFEGKSQVSFPPLNELAQWTKLETGNPAVAEYYTTLTETADQVAKILQGGGTGGTSDAKLNQAQALFQKGFTPDQMAGVATDLQSLLLSRATSMVKDNPYLSTYADQFGISTKNGVTTTNNQIMQDEKQAESKITTYYNASPTNKTLIDDIHTQFPDMSAQEVITKLQANGVQI